MSEYEWDLVEGSDSGHCCFEYSVLDKAGNHICETWASRDVAMKLRAAGAMHEALFNLLRNPGGEREKAMAEAALFMAAMD